MEIKHRYDFAFDALTLKRVDWFGIEMIPHTLQTTLTILLISQKRIPALNLNIYGLKPA